MKKIIFAAFLLVLYGCVELPNRSKPIVTSQLRENKVEADLTTDVSIYNDIVLKKIEEIREENRPERQIKKAFNKKTLQKLQHECFRESVNAINNDYYSVARNKYKTFIEELESRKRDVVPYDVYLSLILAINIENTFYLDMDNPSSDLKKKIKNCLIFDLNKLPLKKIVYKQFINASPTVTKEGDALYLNINYFRNTSTGFTKPKKEKVGSDKFKFTFWNENQRVFIKIEQISENPANVIEDLNGLVILIKKLLSDRFSILSKNETFSISDDYLGSIDSVRKNHTTEAKKINEKTELISTIKNSNIFCLLLKKDFTVFENSKDVSIKRMSEVRYKNSEYLNLDLLHLNILNNANIKLNDHYKISRYLFDNIVRLGLRTFADVLYTNKTDGIAFNVLSSEKNFVRKDDSDFVQYQFYLPKKEILQYINDDITGQQLADSSYILVDGERIELR